MLKFTMENHRVTVDPVSLTLNQLRTIWNADKSKLKTDAVELLSFIHLVSQIDQDAPFANSNPDEVWALACKEIYGDYEHAFKAPFDEEFLKDTITQYQLSFELPEEAAVRTFNKKIHQIERKLDSTDIEIEKVTVKGVTQYVSNFTILDKMMQNLTAICEARDKLQDSIKRGSQRGDTKAGVKISFLERKRREMQANKPKPSVTEDDF
jgi:hypothetical protein